MVLRISCATDSKSLCMLERIFPLIENSSSFASSWWIGSGRYHEDAKTQRIAKFLVAAGLFGAPPPSAPLLVRSDTTDLLRARRRASRTRGSVLR